ncbi:MAG: hypothetical protein LUO93_09050, partial [Methanomicrobiales archaeon]|nr:hypothetical protein [Methanomicrobiales archaeon]
PLDGQPWRLYPRRLLVAGDDDGGLRRHLGEILLATVPGVKHVTRREQDFTQVPAQPAIVITGDEQTPRVETPGLPIEWTFRVYVRIYAKVDPGEGPSDDTLNDILKGIELALEQPEGSVEDLGGLCIRCFIAETVSEAGGAEAGGQYDATIPIDIIAIAQVPA